MSPLNISFRIIILSIMVTLTIYTKSSSIFLAGCVVISFSSGIIILFCYCRVSVNYEIKSSIKIIVYYFLSLIIIINIITPPEIVSLSTRDRFILNSIITLIRIRVVILSLIGINKSIFYPIKGLLTTY